MKLEPSQVAWINEQARRPARRLAAVLRRLQAKGVEDPVLVSALSAAMASLLTVCELTHERLERSRPPMANPYKPSAGKKTRLSLEEETRQRNAEIERGQRDEARKPVGDEVDNPLAY